MADPNTGTIETVTQWFGDNTPGDAINVGIEWIKDNLAVVLGGIKEGLGAVIDGSAWLLMLPPWWVLGVILVGLAWWIAGRGVALFTLVGVLLIVWMGMWEDTMLTVALVLVSTLIALAIGIPVGIAAARSDSVQRIVRPILDFMQTMPAFVYLIPVVFFFSLGAVPGAIATIVFAMPPAVRLTNLGIRQVPEEVVEASDAFGSTSSQKLFKVQLPIAMPTIMAGVNQTIMLALSMVVIAGLVGAPGLGQEIVEAVTRLNLPKGFNAGFAVVILAIYLDRITHAFAISED